VICAPTTQVWSLKAFLILKPVENWKGTSFHSLTFQEEKAEGLNQPSHLAPSTLPHHPPFTQLIMSRLMVCFFLCFIFVLGSSFPTRPGYPRSNRGFKSQGLSTARGFGKRDPGIPSVGQRTNLAKDHQGSKTPSHQQVLLEDTLPLPINLEGKTSFPSSWLIEEMQSNPETAKMIVEKVIDENGDGELTPDELFRRIYYWLHPQLYQRCNSMHSHPSLVVKSMNSISFPN